MGAKIVTRCYLNFEFTVGLGTSPLIKASLPFQVVG